MAEGDIGAVIDTLEFDAVTANLPEMVHVTGEIYAIAYRNDAGNGQIITVSIDAAGAIGAAAIGSLEFGAVTTYPLALIRVDADTYAITYVDDVGDGWIKTVPISAAGAIGAVIDSFEFETGNVYSRAHIAHVSGDVFAIAYTDGNIDGRVITVSIDAAGAIGATAIDVLVFEATRCVDPYIIHVVGEVFAVAYQGVDDDGWLVTFLIDAAGGIGAAIIDSFEWEITDIVNVQIAQVTSSIYGLIYRDAAGDGWIKTVSIDAAGDIGAAVLDSFEFDTADCAFPRYVAVSGDVFAIAYKGFTDDGYVVTVSIDAAGEIGAAVIDSFEFDTTQAVFPTIIHVTGNIYAIAYIDVDGDGQLITVDISTIAAAVADPHLMMMGVG